MSEPKGEVKGEPKGELKRDSQREHQKSDTKVDPKGDQKAEQKAGSKKDLSYEHIKTRAPKILAEMVRMLIIWQKMGFHVPRGVKNIFEFTWDELMVPFPRKSFTGLYCPVVNLFPFDEADSPSASRAPKAGALVSTVKPNYVTPSSENQQMLLKFQKRSIHLLTELLKMKMKIMIDAVAGPSTEEIARQFLEHGQLLCPRSKEEATALMAREPKRKGILKMKGAGESEKDASMDERLDPCPEARARLRVICRLMEEERAAAISKGHTRPLILRNYVILHKSPSQALKRSSLSRMCSDIRRMKGKKFYFSFPDGTSFIYYLSGSIAVCQFPICCIGKTVTLLFQDNPNQALLGTFISQGQSYVRYSFKARSSIALLMDNEGGSVMDKYGFLTHQWSWYSKNQVLQSLEFQINEQMKLKVFNQNSMTVTFASINENITLPLVRTGCTHGSKADKQLPVRNNDSENKEGHWNRSLVEIKRRFEKTVKQFINGVLMVSGICCIEYPIGFHSSKQVKFLMKESPFQAWERKLREDTHASVTEAKGKPRVKLPRARSTASYKDFKGKQRAKTETLAQDTILAPETWASSPMDCPVVLRRVLTKDTDGVCCKCVVKLPLITDLEFEKFLSARRNPRQVIVICVLSPQNHSYSPFFEWSIEKMYIQMQHGRPSPCIQCKHDPYRFLKYDLESPLNQTPPLLVQKHGVVPGMVVMYAGGKLLFGGCVFNGYSYSKRDLLKQIHQACLDCKMGHFLPQSFKFSHVQAYWGLYYRGDTDIWEKHNFILFFPPAHKLATVGPELQQSVRLLYPTVESPKKASYEAEESLYMAKIKELLPEEQPSIEDRKTVAKSKRVSSTRKKTKK